MVLGARACSRSHPNPGRGCRAKGHGAGHPLTGSVFRTPSLRIARAAGHGKRPRDGYVGRVGAGAGRLRDRPLHVLLHVPCRCRKPLCRHHGHRKTALCLGSAVGCAGNTSPGREAPPTPCAVPAARPGESAQAFPPHPALGLHGEVTPLSLAALGMWQLIGHGRPEPARCGGGS